MVHQHLNGTLSITHGPHCLGRYDAGGTPLVHGQTRSSNGSFRCVISTQPDCSSVGEPPCWWRCCKRHTVSVPSVSCGLTVVSRSRRHDSGEYRYVRGKLQRNRERITVRGLNDDNHDLKNLFKGPALSASTRSGPLCDFYVALLEKGMRPTIARLTGTKDCRHYFSHLEERSKARPVGVAV